MNPDGYFSRRRGNANNIDLNRDFPDHGALVANYPWGGTEDNKLGECSLGSARFPFCSLAHIALSCYVNPISGEITMHALMMIHSGSWQVYIVSRSHHKMSLSEEFPGGITNGASWYPIYGGMQDWNYIHAGCFELTLEISDNKWPNASELPTLWEYNKMSLINIAASLVKVKAGRGFADYHRLLASGDRYEEYCPVPVPAWNSDINGTTVSVVMATAPGYKPKTTHISLGEAAMDLDFILDPEVKTKGNLPIINDCSCESKCVLEINMHTLTSKRYMYIHYLQICCQTPSLFGPSICPIEVKFRRYETKAE
ncbi:hypothetical protein NC653_005657 [Populus alba x Populus x berolinensis]|uniref:Peptidase M14 domain-containing protein n=1 Tax=Populus alba x Populus x berolinensis TaxID=444605 RepID=A0AAD6RDQ5_9ROSI|nr:hypothetical protein NC653_005657 [Populus alba x Populus x berolinensis]